MLLKRLLPIIIAGFICIIPSVAKSEAYSEKLSPAIDILQKRQILNKSNLAGSRIDFSEEDFDGILGKNSYQAIIVQTLPDSAIGSLKLDGNEVYQGETIQKENLDQLALFPNSNEIGKTEFQIVNPKSNTEYTCTLSYTDQKADSFLTKALNFETYRNVSLSEKIPLDADQTISVEKNCQNGILSLDSKTGEFTYAPKTNFVGTDLFYYQIKDEYGNFGEIQYAFIKIKKEEKNLYFYDLKDHALHNEAIRLCSSGVLEYEEDPNGLPIFCPEKTVTAKEYLSALQHMRGENAQSEDTHYEIESSVSLGEAMTKIDLLALLTAN